MGTLESNIAPHSSEHQHSSASSSLPPPPPPPSSIGIVEPKILPLCSFDPQPSSSSPSSSSSTRREIQAISPHHPQETGPSECYATSAHHQAIGLGGINVGREGNLEVNQVNSPTIGTYTYIVQHKYFAHKEESE